MSTPPSSSSRDADSRLLRCFRDLAALNALPSMCVGRSPEEALEVVLDALPTALTCDLIYVELPGSPSEQRASLAGALVAAPELPALRAALGGECAARGALEIPGLGPRFCLEVELPIGAARGCLIAGRRTPFDPATDRVLIRSAANLVGTALETAHVLDAARRKDEFIAMLGHELRNPLAPILTAVELLARNPSAAREQRVIERHTRHLARLVDDLLDISRVTRGHIELRSERISLASVLERAVELAAPLVMHHGHTLHVASTDGVILQGDPVRLAQIFGNLLTNAAKFTPPGGRIELALEHACDRVRVTVRDNGRGIACEQLTHIFEPFVQIDRERDSLYGGLGLGLAIVDDLVKRHGGTISAHSEGPGRGASFAVTLPVVAGSAEPLAPPQPEAPNSRAGMRVLVVDDSVDIAELLAEALEIEGFQAAIAHSALPALECWRSFQPHAAILDVGLPELDGYELARRVRAEYGGRPFLIAATGYGQTSDRRKASEAGFDRHFVKPVSVEEIVRALDQRLASLQ